MSKKLSRAKRKELNLRRPRSGVSTPSSSTEASPSLVASSKMTSTAPPPVSQKRRKVPRAHREEDHGEVVASEPVASTRAPKRGPKRTHVVGVLLVLLGVCFAIVYLAKGGLPWGSSKKSEMVAPAELNAPAKPLPSTKIEAPPPAPVPPKAEPSAPAAVEAPPVVESSSPKAEASAPPSAAPPSATATATVTATAAAPPKKPAAPARQPAPPPPRAEDPYE